MIKQFHKNIIIDSYGETEEIECYLSVYSDNTSAIVFQCLDGQAYDSASINLRLKLEQNQTVIKEKYYEILLKEGVIKPYINKISYGWEGEAYLCEINIDKFTNTDM